MKNFIKFSKVIEEIAQEYASLANQKALSPTITEYRVEKGTPIKIFLKKEFDKFHEPEFYVLYLVQLKSPYDSIEFNYDNLWLNDSNLYRVIKISCLKEHGTIIKSSSFDEAGNEKIDNIIKISESDDFGEIFFNERASYVDLSETLGALKNMNFVKLYNGFISNKKTI